MQKSNGGGEPITSSTLSGASSSASSAARKKQNTKRRRRFETFALYIYKVLKQIHPDTGISKKSMVIMNSFILDMFDQLASEAIHLVNVRKRRTLSAREIQTATRLLLPGELAKQAVCEGTKALAKFSQD